MPFNRAFREKQRELKEKNKNKKGGTDGTSKGARSGGDSPFQDSSDVHCKGMSVHITGKLDKYGNWVRD